MTARETREVTRPWATTVIAGNHAWHTRCFEEGMIKALIGATLVWLALGMGWWMPLLGF